jgi:LDH2 family malate/lactate/ureidoglycolate dehydrogenase
MMMSEADDLVLLSVDEVFDLSLRVLEGAGLGRPHAEAVARTLAASQRDECHSHGLHRLPGCVMTVTADKFVTDAEPKVMDAAPALVRVDAGYGYSLLAFEFGLPLLVEKARKGGVAAMAISNCFHFSALWPEVEALTDQGLAGLVMTPSHAWVAPVGGRKGLLGTNPIAFGWPRPGSHPYVFDFATSAVARSDLALHKAAGKAIPEGWGVDSDGNPTTDAATALEGAMLTFGGHKGSALSTMVELMAGALIGERTSVDSMAFDEGLKLAPCHGELVLAFDPVVMSGGDPTEGIARAEALFAGFAAQGARLPSERRYAARARSLAEGVSIARSLHERILALLP